jgi:hypothetical protein
MTDEKTEVAEEDVFAGTLSVSDKMVATLRGPDGKIKEQRVVEDGNEQRN